MAKHNSEHMHRRLAAAIEQLESAMEKIKDTLSSIERKEQNGTENLQTRPSGYKPPHTCCGGT